MASGLLNSNKVLLAALIVLCCASYALSEQDSVQFNRDILPILSDNCFQCHGPDEKKREADLRLDVEASAKQLKEGKGAVVPGKSGESELVRRIFSADADEVMPPPASQRKLTAEQRELLKKWIDGGAEWGGHWAFQKLTAPAVPTPAKFAARLNGPIDGFLFSRLEKENLAPSPEAPRHTLNRRASLDLTGLPPTLEDLSAFQNDASPDAYERLIDRLLASPEFGERMSWEWLEAARYADSNGYQGDGERTMWPWRDWVVSALNRGLPYDQFTLWQLAGDQVAEGGAEQKLATGFCRNHMINGEGGRIAEENRIDYVLDMTETTGTVWLGLTFNCCRCHDHKFDALKKRDYYSLFAFFNQTPVDGGGGNPQSPPAMDVPTAEMTERLGRVEQTVAATTKELTDFETALFPREANQNAADSSVAAKLPDAIKAVLKIAVLQRNKDQLVQLEKQWEKENADYFSKLKALRTRIEERENVRRSIPRVMVMEDMPTPRKTFMLDKGLYDKPQEEVTAATPVSLPSLPADASRSRLGLAQWLVSPDQPLTPRVVVNRFWQQFFGIGIVKTPEDFGVQGERPKHPELLDWLAADFRESAWDTKRLIRQMVTSAAYRQSSQGSASLAEHDPDNRLLARGPRYRLPAWMIRDRALAVSGLLARRVGGPPVKTYQPSGVWEEATFGTKRYQQDSGSALYRRSVYVFWRRIVGPTMFFDSGSRQFCTVKQFRTNTPLHSLATLNDITYVEAARALAERGMLQSEKQDDRLDHIYRLVLSRTPTASEREVLLKALSQFQADYQANPAAAEKLLKVGEHPRSMNLATVEHAAWTALCSAILNLDEALVKEEDDPANAAPDFFPSASLEMLAARAALLKRLRAYFDSRGFLEVETPLLSRDVVVDRHLDPLSVTLFADPREPEVGPKLWLQTSPEFAMKRLLAAGKETLGSIYQITRAFRGGEVGPLHNPEFTMVEWYRIGDDYAAGMQLLADLAEEMLGLGAPERLTYREAFVRYAGIDPFENVAAAGHDLHLDLLLTQKVEPHLGQDRPTILYDYPASQSALARVREGNPPVAERFELYVRGIELANGYHELLDPATLRERNRLNNQLRQADGKPRLPEESCLLAAMDHGLPPCSGCALGFDRLVMTATGAKTIQEVMAFPIERA